MIEVTDLSVGVGTTVWLREHRRQHVLLGRRGVLHASTQLLLLKEPEARASRFLVARMLVILVLIKEAVAARLPSERLDGRLYLHGLVVFAFCFVAAQVYLPFIIVVHRLLTS